MTVFLWHACTFITGGLCQTYIVLIITTGCCLIHAGGRPILPSTTKKVSQSYDEGNRNQEEEIDFTHKEDPSTSQRRLLSRGSQGSLVKLVVNEELFCTKSQRIHQGIKVD